MANYNVKKLQDYGQAPVYTASAAVTGAAQQLADAERKKPQAYTSQYASNINAALDKIINNKGFTYNAATDPLYNQYKDYYTQAGKTAMKDTVGQVTALSGGYGSSYAQTAGQQQYNQYMQQLAQLMPQLEDRAYNRYRDSLSDQYNNLSVLRGLDDSAYGKYRDSVSDYYQNRDYAYGKYAAERDYDYSKYTTALNQFNNDRNFAYGYDRDSISDSQWQTTFNENKRQSDRDYNESVRQFNANMAEQKRQADRDYNESVRQFNAKATANNLNSTGAASVKRSSYSGYIDQAYNLFVKSQAVGQKYIDSLVQKGVLSEDEAIALEDEALKKVKAAQSYDEVYAPSMTMNDFFRRRS
ncbi:MAG: hypothetical protein IJX30_03195 [Clostridia bacterium]|nr:hypothetical protein [Clostridia bacterium]